MIRSLATTTTCRALLRGVSSSSSLCSKHRIMQGESMIRPPPILCRPFSGGCLETKCTAVGLAEDVQKRAISTTGSIMALGSSSDDDNRILVTTASEEDAQEVGEFLVANFFAKEPITVRLKVDLAPYTQDIINYLGPVLQQKVTVKATYGQKCVGVLVSELLYQEASKNAPDFFDIFKEGPSQKVSLISDVLSNLHQGHNLFASYDADCVAHLYMMGVDSSFSGRGIGRDLMLKCESNLREHHGQARVMFAETTGDISASIFKKSSFQRVEEFLYEDFVDQEGHRPFRDLVDHKSAVLWVKPLTPH